eukprot:c20719_g5_i1.p1 GENE.c20719_g5_i1~~c20719_g5_i1.p1  ORF type:complete len:176 (-),score=20.80 c20719_g5_i1:284-811(-)
MTSVCKRLPCPVCLETYAMDSELRCPFVIMPCGHGLCAGCLKRQTTCPICRGQVSGFAKNFSLLDQLELLGAGSVSTAGVPVVVSQQYSEAEATPSGAPFPQLQRQSLEWTTPEKTLEVDMESACEVLLPQIDHIQGRSSHRPAGASRALAVLVSVIGALLIGVVLVLLLLCSEQ